MVCVCDHSTQERQEGRSEILGHPQRHRQFKAGAGCVSEVELLFSLHKALCLIPAIQKEEGEEERRIKRVGKRGWLDPDNTA